MTIFIDTVDQHPDVPKPGERKDCERQDCPGERGYEAGYGMAGGGMGVYTYCGTCGRVIDKVQDEELGL